MSGRNRHSPWFGVRRGYTAPALLPPATVPSLAAVPSREEDLAALRELWRRELGGMARYNIRMAAIYGLQRHAAAEAVRAGMLTLTEALEELYWYPQWSDG